MAKRKKPLNNAEIGRYSSGNPCLGVDKQRNPQTNTHNIDRLARMGMSFSNAHATAPACNASRA